MVGLFDLQDYILDFKRSLKSTRYIRPPAIVKRWSNRSSARVARMNENKLANDRREWSNKNRRRRGRTEKERGKTYGGAEGRLVVSGTG